LNKVDLPLVTVYTLIYNTKPQYIFEAIESVEANNYPRIQHIIIDDHSTNTDYLLEIKKWITENKYSCEFYEHEKNYGISKTMNHVLQLARGKYLVPACDDVLHPDRILHDVLLMEKLGNNYAFVSGRSAYINDKSELIGVVSKVYSYNDVKGNYFDSLVISGNWISAPSVTMRKNSVLSVGGFDERIDFEDYAMWLKLLHSGYQASFYTDLLTYKRIHGDSISNVLDFIKYDIKILLDYFNNNLVRKRVIKLIKKNKSNKGYFYYFKLFQFLGLKKSIYVLQLKINHIFQSY
jgi:glycosyltransferase involved in cell wall biosynthesis